MIETRKISGELTIGILDLKEFSAQNHIAIKREQEKAGSAFLMQHLLGAGVNIGYDSFNKPYLEGRHEHISISHSHDHLVIAVNSTESTGIDIELIRDKVSTIRHKFLNATEDKAAGDDVEKLIIFWAAKEALFKVYGRKELDFRENLGVKFVVDNKLEGTVQIKDLKERFELIYDKIGSYMLVYILGKMKTVTLP